MLYVNNVTLCGILIPNREQMAKQKTLHLAVQGQNLCQ